MKQPVYKRAIDDNKLHYNDHQYLILKNGKNGKTNIFPNQLVFLTPSLNIYISTFYILHTHKFKRQFPASSALFFNKKSAKSECSR